MLMDIDIPILLAIWMPGPTEMVILLALGLLIFGRRLPEVGRSLGKSIVEFKRGIKGIEDDLESESSRAAIASGTSSELPDSASHAESAAVETPAQARTE